MSTPVTFLDLFSLGFMQRALIAALLTGLAAPAIGTFLVQRRLALLGDGTSPTWTAVVVAILGAVLIEVIRERGHTNGDVALALLFYGGLAGGVLITGIAGQGAATLQAYLFGSLNSISSADVAFTAILTVVVLVLTLGLSPQLFAVASDQDFARVAGLRVRGYNLLIAVLAAVSITVAMRTVGLLLVSALMVVPVATSQQLARSFRTTFIGAMLVGCVASVGGLLLSAALSFRVSVAPGPTIVLLALAMFTATWPIGVWLRRRSRLMAPFPEVSAAPHRSADQHVHAHGDDCGHPAVPHGDHVDYVHDGHRHAPHGEHYDEH